MRTKINVQPEFDFEPSHLKVTNAYYVKYEEISTLLDAHPGIVDRVHHDLKDSLQALNNQGQAKKGGPQFKYTSDTVLRVLLCQMIEGLSLRGVVVGRQGDRVRSPGGDRTGGPEVHHPLRRV